MKLITVLILVVFAFSSSDAKNIVSKVDKMAIRKTITDFLSWYKKFQANTSKDYVVVRGGYPDTTTKARIDFTGIDQYLDVFRNTRLVSETFTSGIRNYFADIDKMLAGLPIYHEAVKIPGLDIDPILQTYEPKMILDHINQFKITKLYIIDRKALVSVHFANYTDLLFILTRQGKGHTWIVDYLGPDASAKYSLFKQ